MQPRLDFFIVRPDTRDGRPGPIVPLVAADQLPEWMQLVGVARELDAKQTIGLTNLGIVEAEEDSTFEVRLHYDKIRATPSCAYDATDSYWPGSGKAKAKATQDERTTPNCEAKIKASEKAGSDGSLAISSGNPNNAGPCVVDKTPQHGHSSERVLSASRHSLATSAQACSSNERRFRPHMTKATLDEPRRACPKHTAVGQDKQPATAVCRHWCYHGTCKWGPQCRYAHRMPTTVEGLREIGLKGFPTWYILMVGDAGSELPGLSSLDARLRRLEGVQLSTRQHTRQHTTIQQPRNDTNQTNLCADAINTGRQANAQQQTRGRIPVVTPVRAAARSRVEYGRDSGNDGEGCILPERRGARAGNDRADVTDARSPGVVAGHAGCGEEKLVDIE